MPDHIRELLHRNLQEVFGESNALSPAHREAALNTAHATISTSVATARTRHAA
jgi:hypothetical protein